MSETPEYVETIELSEEDRADLALLGATPDGDEAIPTPEFHTILEVWREILRPAKDEAKKRITPQWAGRMVSAYAGVSFADMQVFHDLYFDMIEELYELVVAEIATDDQCLTWATPEEDARENAQHYRNVLTDWQLAFLQHELDWEPTRPTAAAELGALSEVHKMFFGQTGLVQFLDNIKFEFTETDQAALAAALQALQEASGE